MTSAFVIVREIYPAYAPSSSNINTIEAKLHLVFHSLSTAKAELQMLRTKIPAVTGGWTTRLSHEKQVGGDFLEGFTVIDGEGKVVQTAFIEKVKLGDVCSG